MTERIVPFTVCVCCRCVQRLLDNWDALKVFFSEEKEKQQSKSGSSSYAVTKVDNIFQFIRSPTNHLYCLFLVYAVKMFDQFLLGFQSDEPKIYKLLTGMETLLRSIFSKFLKPVARKNKDVRHVEYKLPYNICTDDQLVIGEEAKQFLDSKDENHLRDARVHEFFKAVKAYYIQLVDYLKPRLPLDDPVLKHARVVDVCLQDQSSISSLRFFLDRFPCLLPAGATVNMVTEQFAEYQGADVSSCIDTRMDQTWVNIGRLTTDEQNYRELSMVMRGILTIPHSSAHCERVFSCVRKNKTPQRASLSDETLESLLVLKSNPLEPVEAVRRMKDECLDALKKAYSKSQS